jgi:hypothetical protein
MIASVPLLMLVLSGCPRPHRTLPSHIAPAAA